MHIPLTEPTAPRYITINQETNQVHLMVPVVSGQEISTDNTCKATVALRDFFDGGALRELTAYKDALAFDIQLLEVGNPQRVGKEERLAQIEAYIGAVSAMRMSFGDAMTAFLGRPSNLYSTQLRPRAQDSQSRVVNPVFNVNRINNAAGIPQSRFYNAMHSTFPTTVVAATDPRTRLTTAVLNAIPASASFADIQRALGEQSLALFGLAIDFTQRTDGTPATKEVIDALMGFGADVTREDYIDALLGACALDVWETLPTPPFYSIPAATPVDERTERLSILTQFFLANLNVYCKARGISGKNFGVVLDASPDLSNGLASAVSTALTNGEDVERAICNFCNVNVDIFDLSRAINAEDLTSIRQTFERTYRTVTATNENPHMDDFMLLDTEARGKNDIFATHQGLIFTNFANIAPKSPHETYFANIRQEAATHPGIITSQNEPVITVDIEPEALVDKLSDVQWETLPKEVIDACCALPGFLFRQLLDDVAKGKQDEAETILQLPTDTQILLRTPGKFTDYSGRTFHCTAYEYAYWAKDTHMCRMLERHMDDETKTQLLDKINAVERSGLAYQQYGVPYQNPHYDMSFVLKKLSVDEFRQLQTMVGQNNTKIQQATTDNYQSIPFTATEYEQLKITIEPHQPWYITTFFYTSTVKAISDKLQFDFHSLITALETYVNNYDRWDFHKRERAWTSIGKAQRDVPAHIAHEYCRLDRSFYPEPLFNEETLPRVLTLNNYNGTNDKAWYPLTSPSSGPGFDFVITRRSLQLVSCDGRGLIESPPKWVFGKDLAAVRHLDEVRVADLTLSRANLSQVENQIGLGF